MKIPGLFSKSAKYHRFEYKPRYYDPKKEEAEAREERLRRELAAQEGKETVADEETFGYRTRMAGAFQQARKRSKPAGEPNAAMLRLAILLILVLLIIGFLTWGPKVVYSLFLVFPVWIYIRFFKKNGTS